MGRRPPYIYVIDTKLPAQPALPTSARLRAPLPTLYNPYKPTPPKTNNIYVDQTRTKVLYYLCTCAKVRGSMGNSGMKGTNGNVGPFRVSEAVSRQPSAVSYQPDIHLHDINYPPGR